MVLNYTSLVACLKKLATHCSNEGMYRKKRVEYMKAQKCYRSFQDDNEFLNLYDDKIVEILSINLAYSLDFLTVKQLLYKVPSETI